MDVVAWLHGLGLSRYEAAFRGQGGLRSPAEVDGGRSEGARRRRHRRSAKNFWRRLGIQASAGPRQNESGPALRMCRTAPTDPGFRDLVSSTALSVRLDPEDLRGVVGAYHGCCADWIDRKGGFVAKYLGDGVLAYFGYPNAHEDDAERAVQAALAIVEAVPRLVTAAGSSLQVRVGIATGVVVVGDLIGSGGAREPGIVGETPNLAARLQSLAEPNTVIIAEGTRRLLGSLFELQDLGVTELKGISGPVRVWAVLRASSVESRFDALHTARLGPLIGREEELQLLLRCWSRAKSSEGQVGAPGRRVSANRGSWRHWWRALPRRLTRACDFSALRSTRTVRFIQSLDKWSALPASRWTILCKQNWISLMRCLRRPQRRCRTQRDSQRCYRYRTTAAIRRLNPRRSSAGGARWTPWLDRWKR